MLMLLNKTDSSTFKLFGFQIVWPWA